MPRKFGSVAQRMAVMGSLRKKKRLWKRDCDGVRRRGFGAFSSKIDATYVSKDRTCTSRRYEDADPMISKVRTVKKKKTVSTSAKGKSSIKRATASYNKKRTAKKK